MIKAAEHFSFTVSNMEESLHFFCDLLGLKQITPIVTVDAEGLRKVVGMADAALRLCLVRLPEGKNIELIEYLQPKGVKLDLRTCNPGVAHIAFEVDNLKKTVEDLTKKGVKFVSEPVEAPGNDGTGTWSVCYLRGPDGITMEMIEKLA